MNNYKEILELDQMANKQGKRYPHRRYLFNPIQKFIIEPAKHLKGIIGPRGVGKTILLKQIRSENDSSIYISLDSISLDIDLFNLIKDISDKFNISLFLLDEVHFIDDYSLMLKKIYDFLNVKVIFTSSVSLSLYESAYDLSRRVKLLHLYPFSFRKYLFFKHKIKLPALTMGDIINQKWQSDHLKYGYYFEDYLQGGLYPFSLVEPDVLDFLKNVIKKVIRKDIPKTASLKIEELEKIEKVIEFISKSQVDGINYSTVSQNIGITKYKAEQYLKLLEKAFILFLIFPKGTNVLKEPKVLIYPPYRLLYKDYNFAIGGLREDIFSLFMKLRGIKFSYLKSKRGAKTPDFLVKLNGDKIVAEIGGKGKGRTQFKDIQYDKKIIFSHSDKIGKIRRPLYLLGYC